MMDLMQPAVRRPCPICGGPAAAVDTDKGIVMRCLVCGLQGRPYSEQNNAAREWNRRDCEGAKVLPMDAITESEWGYFDRNGNAAGWLELRGVEGVEAVVVRCGIHWGETTMQMMRIRRKVTRPEDPDQPPEIEETAHWHRMDPGEMATYGLTWRIWDRVPGKKEMGEVKWQRRQ